MMAKKNLPDDVVKGLKGFEDVFDDYLKDEEKKSFDRWEKEKEKKGDQYELANFLEIEEERIASVEKFLTKKVSQQVNFSQVEKLIHMQAERKNLLYLKLLPELMGANSKFKANLSSLFNSHFT